MSKKIEGNQLITIYKRDNLGRILEERKENLRGKILSKIKYKYDVAGNKKTTTSFIANEESTENRYYDVFNRLTKSIDALNKETNISYPFKQDQKEKIVINENAMVISMITPNCTCGGIDAKISIPNPNVVVKAAINNAPPVLEIVSVRAALISPVLSATSLNRSVAWIA